MYIGNAASTVAVDLSTYFKSNKFKLGDKKAIATSGIAITNIGAKIKYSNDENFIPTNLRLGGAFTFELDPKNKLTFASDFNKLLVPSPPRDNSTPLLSGIFGSFTDASGGFKEEMSEIMISIGTEYWYNDTFAGRLGYFHEATNKGNRKYITGGVGFRYQRFGIDVAYIVPTNKRENALAETIRFTLMLNIESKARENDSVTDN